MFSSVGGCQNSPLLYTNIHVNQAPIPVITQSNDTLFTDPTFAGYQWYLNGNPISGANGVLHVPLVSGMYMVSIVDSNGCIGFSELFEFILSSEQELSVSGIQIYPNPFDESFVISLAELPGVAEVTISDITGKTVLETRVTGNTNTIALKEFPSGVYTLKLENAKTVIYRKLVKN